MLRSALHVQSSAHRQSISYPEGKSLPRASRLLAHFFFTTFLTDRDRLTKGAVFLRIGSGSGGPSTSRDLQRGERRCTRSPWGESHPVSRGAGLRAGRTSSVHCLPLRLRLVPFFNLPCASQLHSLLPPLQIANLSTINAPGGCSSHTYRFPMFNSKLKCHLFPLPPDTIFSPVCVLNSSSHPSLG